MTATCTFDVFCSLDGYGSHETGEGRTLDGHTQELVYRPTLHSA